MTDRKPTGTEVLMLNELFAEVLRTIAQDDKPLAEMWLGQMQAAGSWYVTPPTDADGVWRDVLVDGDRFCRLAAHHPKPGRFTVKFSMWGRVRVLELQLVTGGPVG